MIIKQGRIWPRMLKFCKMPTGWHKPNLQVTPLAFPDVFPPFSEGNKQDDNQPKQTFEFSSLRGF